MKVLITGVYGFIGYSIAVRLMKQGHSVIGIDKVRDAKSEKSARVQNLAKFPEFQFHDVNLSNFEQTRTLFNLLAFDTIIHLAGQYAVAYNTPAMLSFSDGNLRSWLHVMDCAKTKGIGRVIYASSTFVEDNVLPANMYGATLEFRERAANVYSSQFGMETVGLRFGSTYGPYMRADVGIYSLAKKLFRGETINVTEGGFNYAVNFLYIADACEVMARLLEKPLARKHNVFTLVSAKDRLRDLGEILKLMESMSGRQAKTVGGWPLVPEGFPDPAKFALLTDAINYVPHTKMEEGLAKFIEWFDGRFSNGKI